MNIELNLSNLLFILFALIGAFWALLKVSARQFKWHLDKQFASQEESRKANHEQLAQRLTSLEQVNREESAQWQRLERDLLRMQADLPLQYVRRDDYIRGQSVIEAKLDGLANKIEITQLRAAQQGVAR